MKKIKTISVIGIVILFISFADNIQNTITNTTISSESNQPYLWIHPQKTGTSFGRTFLKYVCPESYELFGLSAERGFHLRDVNINQHLKSNVELCKQHRFSQKNKLHFRILNGQKQRRTEWFLGEHVGLTYNLNESDVGYHLNSHVFLTVRHPLKRLTSAFTHFERKYVCDIGNIRDLKMRVLQIVRHPRKDWSAFYPNTQTHYLTGIDVDNVDREKIEKMFEDKRESKQSDEENERIQTHYRFMTTKKFIKSLAFFSSEKSRESSDVIFEVLLEITFRLLSINFIGLTEFYEESIQLFYLSHYPSRTIVPGPLEYLNMRKAPKTVDRCKDLIRDVLKNDVSMLYDEFLWRMSFLRFIIDISILSAPNDAMISNIIASSERIKDPFINNLFKILDNTTNNNTTTTTTTSDNLKMYKILRQSIKDAVEKKEETEDENVAKSRTASITTNFLQTFKKSEIQSYSELELSSTNYVFTVVFSTIKDPQRHRHISPTYQYFKNFYESVLFHRLKCIILYDHIDQRIIKEYETPLITFVSLRQVFLSSSKSNSIDHIHIPERYSINEYRYKMLSVFLEKHCISSRQPSIHYRTHLATDLKYRTHFTNKYRLVVDKLAFVDVSDVVFLHNPFKIIEKQDTIWLSADRGTVLTNGWMKRELKKCMLDETMWIEQERVWNAGVWASESLLSAVNFTKCIVDSIENDMIVDYVGPSAVHGKSRNCDMPAFHKCVHYERRKFNLIKDNPLFSNSLSGQCHTCDRAIYHKCDSPPHGMKKITYHQIIDTDVQYQKILYQNDQECKIYYN